MRALSIVLVSCVCFWCVLLATGCGAAGLLPSSPTPESTMSGRLSSWGEPYPVRAFPPEAGNARVYVLVERPYQYGTQAMRGEERYVLYNDGWFAFHFVRSDGTFTESLGRFTEDSGGLVFRWDRDGRQAAKGTLEKQRLSIHYNDVMEMSDFTDGIFQLTQ